MTMRHSVDAIVRLRWLAAGGLTSREIAGAMGDGYTQDGVLSLCRRQGIKLLTAKGDNRQKGTKMTEEENTALVELPGGGLRRGLTDVPAGSKVWSNARVWAQNIRPEMWFPYLQTSRPDLCDLSDVMIYQTHWRVTHVWPALLALATEPAPTQPEHDGEAEMATKKTRLKTKKPRTVKATNGAEKKARKPGSGALIQEMILAGKDTDQILEKVRKEFPDSKAKAQDVSFHRTKLRQAGHELPRAKAQPAAGA